jgi:hypothetical protein
MSIGPWLFVGAAGYPQGREQRHSSHWFHGAVRRRLERIVAAIVGILLGIDCRTAIIAVEIDDLLNPLIGRVLTPHGRSERRLSIRCRRVLGVNIT